MDQQVSARRSFMSRLGAGEAILFANNLYVANTAADSLADGAAAAIVIPAAVADRFNGPRHSSASGSAFSWPPVTRSGRAPALIESTRGEHGWQVNLE